MLRIGSMNLMLHGLTLPRFRYADTLSKGFNEERDYDIVLANPPFKGTEGNEVELYTSQICTPCLSDASTSGRAGRNSCATCPLNPVSTIAFITAG